MNITKFFITLRNIRISQELRLSLIIISPIYQGLLKILKTLGCVLFSRTSRGVKLTPEGETLYSHIVPAILQIEAGEKELLMQKELKSGII